MIHPGDELVEAPFRRARSQQAAFAPTRYEGFWAPMDTLRDLEGLEVLARSGTPALGCLGDPQ